MRDHRKLRAFELADSTVMAVYQVTRLFPREEQFGLVSQLRRAAVSTATNIVEGCARNSEADLLRFLDIAYGSAREVEYQLSVAHRLGFIPEMDFLSVNDLCAETAKVIHGLIRALRNKP